MKDPCTVSVLMPVHNGEKYLAEAIESVLKQTFTDFEFLLINDGSTDGTERIIREYALQDKRIRYIENPKNLGLVETLNRGLAMAEGKYVARMDADDVCHPERFQKQVGFLEQQKEISVCGTYYQFIGKNNSISKLPVEHDEIKAQLLFSPEMCHPSIMYRAGFLKKNGIYYKPETFPAEDYAMWLDCAKITHLHNIPEVLLYYRVHDRQITREKHRWQLQQVNRIRIQVLDYLWPGFSEEQKKFHIESFMSYPVMRISEYSSHKRWGRQLILENKHFGNFNEEILGKVIDKYITNRAYNYFVYTIKNNRFGKALYLLMHNGLLIFSLRPVQVKNIIKQLFSRFFNHG